VEAKELLRSGDPVAAGSLADAAAETARRNGLGEALTRAADSIGLAREALPERG
jgi:hypothetical protein